MSILYTEGIVVQEIRHKQHEVLCCLEFIAQVSRASINIIVYEYRIRQGAPLRLELAHVRLHSQTLKPLRACIRSDHC